MALLTPASNAELKAARIWHRFDQMVLGYTVRYSVLAERILHGDAGRAAAGYLEGGELAALASIQTGPWIAFLTKLWITVTQAGGEFTAKDLDAEVPDSVLERSAVDWLKENAETHAGGVVNTTQDTTRKAIAAGKQAGASTNGIAAMISASVTDTAQGRGQNIGRTETHSSANHGSFTAASYADISAYKIWIATPDDRTRDQHREAHNQRVKITEPFIVGGERLMYPGHWSLGASGWNIYNCRCAMRYIKQRLAR